LSQGLDIKSFLIRMSGANGNGFSDMFAVAINMAVRF
jgi:hypothetical protein